MKGRTISILLFIFLALLVLTAVPWISKEVGNRVPGTVNKDLDMSVYTAAGTETITVRKGSDEAVLQKTNGTWQVGTFPADPKIVESFFSALGSVAAGSVVSRNVDNHDQFDATEVKGTVLTLKGTGGEKTYILGKETQEVGGFYAKAKGSANVYAALGGLPSAVSARSSFWRNKTVLSFDKSAIGSISLSGAVTATLTKSGENKWTVAAGGKSKEFAEADLTSLFANALPLEAYEFLTEAERAEFDKAKQKTTVTFRGTDQSALGELMVYKKDSDLWVKEAKMSVWFKVYGYRLNDLLNVGDKVR